MTLAAGLLATVLGQTRPALNQSQAMDQARDRHTLAIEVSRSPGDPFWPAALADTKCAATVAQFVTFPGGSKSPFSLTFLDTEGGQVSAWQGPADPALLQDWMKTVLATWKDHEALTFRTQKRASERDIFALAFDKAGRGDPAGARSSLASLQFPGRQQADERAWMAVAQAFERKRLFDDAIVAWQHVRSSSLTDSSACASRAALSMLFKEQRKDELARAELTQLLDWPHAHTLYRDWAAARLKEWEDR